MYNRCVLRTHEMHPCMRAGRLLRRSRSRTSDPYVCEHLTHACQQDSLRQHRVGGRAEGKPSGRDEEVQSEWAGQQTHLPHSAPQDVSPEPPPPPPRPTAPPLSVSQAERRSAQGRSSSFSALRFPPAGFYIQDLIGLLRCRCILEKNWHLTSRVMKLFPSVLGQLLFPIQGRSFLLWWEQIG